MRTTDLKAFLAKAQKVVGNRADLPVLEFIHIKDGRMQVSNLKSYLSKKIEGLPTELEALVPLNELNKIVSKLKDSAIEIIREGDSISVITDKGTFKLPSAGKLTIEKDWPTLKTDKMVEIEGGLSLSDTLTIIKALPFANTDETRPVYCQVRIERSHIVATDFHTMLFEPRVIVQESEIDSFSVPNAVVKLLDKTSYAVKHNIKYVSLTDEEGLELTYSQIEGVYPNWRTVLPKEVKSQFQVSKAALLEALDLCSIAMNEGSGLVIFENDPEIRGDLKLSTIDIDLAKSYQTTLEVNNSGDTLQIGLKHSLLLRCLKYFTSNDVIIINMVDSSKPTVINGSVLLMPMMIPD